MSTGRGELHFNSIDAQLRAAREKSQLAGWTVIKEFVVAESAKRGAE